MVQVEQQLASTIGSARLDETVQGHSGVVERLRDAERRLSPLPSWRLFGARVAGIALVILGARYLLWRTSTLEGTGVLGATFFAFEMVSYLSITGTIALSWRLSQRARPNAQAFGSLDIFIPVYNEPVAMVERTLRAALAINYPHKTYILNDGRLNDTERWRDYEVLARRYGVVSFARGGGGRNKAANMNHALQRSCGDVIAVIDADHEARPDFADQVLGYFAEPDVGFVATPQEFDSDPADRLYNRETYFYRTIQRSKDQSNAATSCGNAALYRRVALESIGGFSEWGTVEDLHTSLRLHGAGWRSVYHPVPLTVGVAPTTAAEWAIQRQRWATDGLRILFFDNPLRRPGLTMWQRAHYFHTASHYIIACLQMLFLLSPALYLLWDKSAMRFDSMHEYLTYSVAHLATLALYFVLHAGWRSTLRTFQSFAMMGPVALFGLVRALTGLRYHRPVTEKEAEARFSFLLVPHVVFAGLAGAAVAVALSRRDEGLQLAGVWAAWGFATLMGLASFSRKRMVVTRFLRGTGLIAAAAAIAALLLPVPTTQIDPPTAISASDDRPPVATPATGARLVAPLRGLYLGSYEREPLSSRRVSWDGVPLTIVAWYQHWVSDWATFPDFPNADARRVIDGGGVPLITWEAWEKPKGVHGPDQPAFALRRIAAGDFDDYIERWAAGAAAFRDPVLLRFMHEMNGNWYPWSVVANGNTGADFVAAWQHVHGIFRRAGANNVSWVWTLQSFTGDHSGFEEVAAYYPGDDYVDWTSMNAFNWGTARSWGRWRTIDEVIGRTYDALMRFGKPIMISEAATVARGGDAVAWARDAVAALATRFSGVSAVLWFDDRYPGNVDFRSSPGIRSAVAAELQARSWAAALSTQAVSVGSPRTPPLRSPEW